MYFPKNFAVESAETLLFNAMLSPTEEDPTRLWDEIHALRSAAAHERERRVQAEELTAQIGAWRDEGEAIFQNMRRVSVAFRLGAWWADRPWR